MRKWYSLTILLIPTSCNLRNSVTSAFIMDPARMTELRMGNHMRGGKETWGQLENTSEDVEN